MNNFDSAQTLEQRLSAGRLSAGEALRIAAQVADHLRQLHDQGGAHGALTPAAILLGTNVQVQPAPAAAPTTPYSAPEVLMGHAADARSDVFSYGAIVYEMLTGRRAFDGTNAAPAPSGSVAVDRLVAGCVALLPDARFQQIQKLQFELRLLTNAARRGAPLAAAGPVFVAPAPASAPVPDTMLHNQMQELETRIAHRFEEQDRAVASVERVANELLKALRSQPPQPQPSQSSYSRPASRGFGDLFEGDPSGRVEKALEMLHDKIARFDMVLGTAVERIQKLEENLDAFDTDAAALRDSVTRDIRNFERALKQQSTAIESARTAMGQTDDLVERVVEALDSLQTMVIGAEDRTLAAS